MTAADERLERARAAVGPRAEVEGWATVDLERAQSALCNGGPAAEPVPDDELLGARCRLLRRGPDAADQLVLLEPATEGRLAASLARHGEGRAVTYLLAGSDAAARLRAAGLLVSAEAGGPLGPSRLVLGGERWGPHVIVVSGGTGSR